MLRFRPAVAGMVALASLWLAAPLAAQLTVPERTNYTRTSSHAEVMAFIDSLQHRGVEMYRGVMGRSPKGRPIPYVVLSRPQVTSPAAARRTGKPLFYIQANIHAGEVEGKEAVQELMRDLTLGSLRPLLDSVIIIFAPIYNGDGNDAFGPARLNRGEQNGPPMVGLRADGAGYDLNRDYVKEDAPETRASLTLLTAWDPDVFMDLHTTDGSYHGYALTWSPGLNPNHTPTNDWVQDTVLEAVRTMVRDQDHFETYPYGNFRGGNDNPTGWDTYESLPRYGTNLEGMTRVSILSEAFSHDSFPRRIAATYAFVLESIRYLSEHRTALRQHESLTSAARPDSVVVRGNDLQSSPSRMDTVLVAITRSVPRPPVTPEDSAAMARAPRTPVIRDTIGCSAMPAAQNGGRGRGRGRGFGGGGGGFGGGRGRGAGTELELTGQVRPVYMEVHDRFGPVLQEKIPAAYILDPDATPVVELLRRQGVRVERTTREWIGNTSHFRVDSLRKASFFQGHCGTVVDGRWEAPSPDTVATHSYLISTDQRLGMLASFLLEPASEDGYVYWNFFDRGIAEGRPAPIRRVGALPQVGVADVH
jgi:Zinc carboxypeptidase